MSMQVARRWSGDFTPSSPVSAGGCRDLAGGSCSVPRPRPRGHVRVDRGHRVRLLSSGDLVSKYYAVWTPRQREEHDRASEVVRKLARDAFDRAAERIRSGQRVTEASWPPGSVPSWRRAAPPTRRTASWRLVPPQPIRTTTPVPSVTSSREATCSSSTSGAPPTPTRPRRSDVDGVLGWGAAAPGGGDLGCDPVS